MLIWFAYALRLYVLDH